MHFNLPKELLMALKKDATLKSVVKNDILCYPGRINRTQFFIEEGLLRGYRLTNGKDFTHHFYTTDWFATDFKSYLLEEPSELYIQALADTKYYEFSKQSLNLLFESDPKFEKIGRLLAENAYLVTVNRLTEMQTLNLTERYAKLIEQSPKLFQSVPQKYIASYLGVSEQSLSRIKNDFLTNVNY